MKKFLLSFCLMAFVFSLNAQNNQNRKGEFGLQVAGSAAVNPVQTYSISVQPYYKLTSKLGLGLGVGVLYTNHLGDDHFNHFSVPLYADLKYAFLNRKVSPYIEVKRGVNFGVTKYDAGSYANFGLNYSSFLLGVSVFRSDISFGFISYDCDQFGENAGSITDGCFAIQYAYNFKLNDKHATEEADKVYDTEDVMNGKFNLLVSAETGILDPYISLAEFEFPLNLNVGVMAEYRNRVLSVGIGADVEATSCLSIIRNIRDVSEERFCSIPLYGDIRATFGKSMVRPFVDIRGGYAFALNTLKIHDNHLVIPTEIGEAKTEGLYATGAVGLSVGHSDFSLGVSYITMTGILDTREFTDSYYNLFFRYSYRFNVL